MPGNNRTNDIDMAVQLTLPEEAARNRKMDNSNVSHQKYSSTSAVPKEFLCSINGHVMKDPVRANSGEVFEKDTIKIWSQSNGCVNPISFEPLYLEDLHPDDELRTRIKRYHIEKTRHGNVSNKNGEVDLYDF